MSFFCPPTRSLNHLGLVTPDLERLQTFYLAALKPIGYKKIITIPDKPVVGLGSRFPDFWLSGCPDSDSDTNSNSDLTNPPMHIAFSAANRQQVRDFHTAALAAGAKCNGEPGLRPQYMATYYGAYVIDPDGRNVEVVCYMPEMLAEGWVGRVGCNKAIVTVLSGIVGAVGVGWGVWRNFM